MPKENPNAPPPRLPSARPAPAKAKIPIPPATPGVTYHYDKAGQFVGATETIDNTTREYDAAGRVTLTFVRDGRKVVVFDADGRVLQHGGSR